MYDFQLFDYMAELGDGNKQVYIGGDFNLPEMKWPPNEASAGNSPAGYLASVVQNSNLTQLITQPTRFRTNQQPSLLDLFFTNNEESVTELEICPPLARSDHVVVDINLQFSVETLPQCSSRHISIINYERANAELLTVNWENELSALDVDSMWLTFTDKLQSILKANTTISTLHRNPGKPWITHNIIRMTRVKKSLWQRYRRSGSGDDFLAHRQYSESLARLIIQSKAAFENHVAGSADKKLFFKTVRSRLQSKVSVPKVQRCPGVLCCSSEEVADEFARSFSSHFTTEPRGNLPTASSDRVANSVGTVTFTPDLLKSLLTKLNPSTAPGPDLIESRTMKLCCEGVALPLSMIMTASFRQHTLPKSWLSGVITPIYKKGNRLDASNYRPITLTSVVCKLMERVVKEDILRFAMENNLLPKDQHGFIPGRSVITNLLACMNDWSNLADNGSPVDIIYIDFAKAFDRVPHRRLLSKLEHFGIRGHLLMWIRAYLSERTFQVKVGNTLSPPCPVTSGVPQGSCLGPLLFLIYTADLPNVIKSRCAFFADDVKVYGNPFDSDLSTDIAAIEKWCDEWLLPVNPNKCSILHIGKNNPKRRYNINNTQIATVTSQLDLGVIISDDLSWSAHIQHVASKANRMLYLIRKAFPNCTLINLGQFYRIYIRPILEYAGPVWHPSLQRDVDLLENIQRKATRLTLGVNRPAYEERLRHCSLTQVYDRKLRGDLIITYRAIHGLFGVDLSHLFPLNINHLRGHNLKLRKQNFHTSARQLFLPNRVFDVWNSLPASVVNAPSVNAFKNSYDRCCRS